MKLKKRCKYCSGIVKIKEEEIEYFEDNGRGVLCDLCGNFIEVPRKPSSISRTISGHRSYRHRRKAIKNQKIAFTVIITIAALFMMYVFIVRFPGSFFWEKKEKENSTFQFLDEYTDYDISNELNISILTPKNGVVFDENKDIYIMSNFEETIHKNASLIQIDLRNLAYIWIFTDPMNISTYRSNYYLVVGGINYDYVFNIKLEDVYYHLYNFSSSTL